jgi:hypothetical protein
MLKCLDEIPMKYFLAILISFAFVNPALAAKTVKGSVPVVKPLQPAPAGVSPAFNRSIQYQDPNYQPNSGQSPQNSRPGQSSSAEGSLATVAKTNGGHNYIWRLAVLLVLIAAGFFVYKRSKSK